MYYLEWEDGSRSRDFYNKTRAKEFIRLEEIHNLKVGQIHNAPQSPREAR